MKVIFDGKCLDVKDAKVGVTDRGFLCGDGVFTTLQVCDGKPLCLERHYERLERHCIALHIAPPVIDRAWVGEVIKANNATTGIWRLRIYITGGEGYFTDMTPRSSGHVLVMMRPYESHFKPPCCLKTYPHVITRPHAYVKTLAYLDRYWVKDFCRQEGCDESIVLSPEGYICEAAYANIFWRCGNELFSPDPFLPIIHGISLNMVIKAAEVMGMKVHRVKAKWSDVPDDANIYISNSMINVLPVNKIDNRTFPLDPTFEKKLMDNFHKQVELNSGP